MKHSSLLFPLRALFCSALLVGSISEKSHAAIVVFEANWAGAANGNSATAVALIGIDTALVPNPGSDSGGMPVWFDSITLTITGASSGNGTFTKSDFDFIFWETNGGTLDFTTELVGQSTSGSPWGSIPSSGEAGDFNLFASTVGAPTGTWWFQLTTNGGSGDTMDLVSLEPAISAIPEPSSSLGLMALLTIGIVGTRSRGFRKWIPLATE